MLSEEGFVPGDPGDGSPHVSEGSLRRVSPS